MDVRINSYRPATIASRQVVNQTKKIDNGQDDKSKEKTLKVPDKKKEETKQRIDTYAAYRKRKYAERIKTRFDLFL